jgi:hypothetical protein
MTSTYQEHSVRMQMKILFLYQNSVDRVRNSLLNELIGLTLEWRYIHGQETNI